MSESQLQSLYDFATRGIVPASGQTTIKSFQTLGIDLEGCKFHQVAHGPAEVGVKVERDDKSALTRSQWVIVEFGAVSITQAICLATLNLIVE